MRTEISRTISAILTDTAREIEMDKSRQTVKRLKHLIHDAVPLRSFSSALSSGRALIGEIKERSPSQGRMRPQNFKDAAAAYKKSPVVKAISVLTSWNNFGQSMRVEMMEMVKRQTGKPVLRKDFIIEEYQVYQARAYGADAILLMANVLERDELRRLSDLAFELGMDVLFETHRPEELEELPETARIVGINSRSFDGGAAGFRLARFFRQFLGSKVDRSVDLNRFDYVQTLPGRVIKVAESGVSSGNCGEVFDMGFHAILVGTSLLMDERGVDGALKDFEAAIRGVDPKKKAPETPTDQPQMDTGEHG
jgi:indole-3-glycerol phosphate synthase